MANAAAGSGRCARRVLLVDLCGAGEAGASARTVGDGCCAGRTCHRVRRNALFDGPGLSAIRGTEIGRPDALTSSKTVQMRRRPDRLGDPITSVMPKGGISPGTHRDCTEPRLLAPVPFQVSCLAGTPSDRS